MPNDLPEISIVVPVFNEAPNLETLYTETILAMEELGRAFEFILVDDGSSDGSFAVLKRLQAQDARLRVVRLARNFGQNPALYAGFSRARGGILVTLDADLQNPPSEIPKLISALEESDLDIAQGWRTQREDNPFRRMASRGVNGCVSLLTGTRIKDLGSGMKAYRREIIDQLLQSTHRARYLPAETAWLRARVGEVRVEHRQRAAGRSKYGLFALLRVNFDMITSISTAPIQIIALIGGLFGFIGLAMGVRVAYLRIVHAVESEFQTILAIFFFLAGVQMFCTSIMCQYISRIYVEVQQRPYFIIGEELE